jgi:translation initiation factor 4G
MIPPHMMMLQMPGVAPGFPFGMPQPLGGIQQPVLTTDGNATENVLSHMNRKKNVLKFFTPNDTPSSESKDAPASAPVPAASPAPAPVADHSSAIKKHDDPSPRASGSPRAVGSSPRAVAATGAAFANLQIASDASDSSGQIEASAHVPRISLAEEAKALPAAAAAPAATPSPSAASPATATVPSQSTPKPSLQPQHPTRSSMNLLGAAVSPSAPAHQQSRPAPSAARGGQSAAVVAASAQAPAPSGAGRTVYTRELLNDLRNRALVSPQTLDRINALKLGLNCAPAIGSQGGRLPNGVLPLPQGLNKRLPQPGKPGSSMGARAQAPSRPVHVPSENSFVAKMQKMTDDIEKKKKSIQLILNQLTAENFVKLCEKLYTHIDSIEALEIVQTKIYDKAVLDQQQNPAPGQPTFVELYARVCHIIVQDNQHTNPSTGAPGKLFFNPDQLPPEQAKGGQFRRSLLNRCQQEFERPSQGKCEGWQQLSEEERFIQQMKEKRRTLGNVDFVGQLFLHGLLAEKTLHHCFKLLLENHYEKFDAFSKKGAPPPQDSDFDQLESFCKLLTTVGRTVDRPQAKQFMDGYFSYLQQIMGQPTIIPRMKFHIEQIIELRRCGWDMASMRQERSMPSASGKSQKGPVAVLARPTSATLPAKTSSSSVQLKAAPTVAGGKHSPSAAPTSAAPKQPPSSKPANGKTPLSGSSSNGAPPAPAKPKVDLMSLPLVHFLDDPDVIDAQHQRSLDSMLDEWKCNHLHAEVADCLRELNQCYTHAFFVFNVVTQCCDKGAHFVAKCAELLETLMRQPNCLSAAKLDEALKHLTSKEFIDDYSLDCPSYKQFMTEILARGLLFYRFIVSVARLLTLLDRHG